MSDRINELIVKIRPAEINLGLINRSLDSLGLPEQARYQFWKTLYNDQRRRSARLVPIEDLVESQTIFKKPRAMYCGVEGQLTDAMNPPFGSTNDTHFIVLDGRIFGVAKGSTILIYQDDE